MVDLFQSLQHVYAKWEDKDQRKAPPILSTRSPRSQGSLPPTGNGGVGDVVSWNRHTNGLNSFQHPLRRNPSRSQRLRASAPTLLELPYSSMVGDFKSSPTIFPKTSQRPPNMGLCCSRCLPSSRASLIDEKTQRLGFNNILLVPAMNRNNNWLIRQFPFVYHVTMVKLNTKFPDISSKVLQDENVQNAVEKAVVADVEEFDLPDESSVLLTKKYKQRIHVILKNMKTCISGLITRLTCWWFFRLLSRLLLSVQVNQGHIEVLKRASEAKLPLIFLPLHRSHLDYILVSFTLCNYEIDMPLIASGDNLRMPIIGYLIQRLGGFFIKRTFLTKEGKKDHLYQAVMQSYMQNCLKTNRNMEFYIEGGRSRTGKTSLPKGGLLAVLVDSCLNGIVPDAYIVPVSVNYEKLVDGNFVSEEMGHSKVMESFWSTIKAVWRAANSNYGMARIEFSQPFSLREFIESFQVQKKNVFTSNANHLSDPLCFFDGNDEARRCLVSYLADHVSYDATHCVAIMSTNMVAFLLLNKFRKGVPFTHLVSTMKWLQEELFIRGRDVGFSGPMEDVVRHAVDMLGSHLIQAKELGDAEELRDRSLDGDESTLYLQPVVTLPRVIELSYYSNSLASVFALESVVANSIYSLTPGFFPALSGCESRVFVSRQLLQEKANLLCSILKYEFIFVPPCSTLTFAIQDVIDKFITYEILATAPSSMSNPGYQDESQSLRRLSCEDWNSDSDYEDTSYDVNLKVNLSESSLEQLEFLRNITSPLIESYWLVSSALDHLLNTQIEESNLLAEIRRYINSKTEAGLIFHEESISANALRNALKLFESWKVLESQTQDAIKLVFLSDAYNNNAQLGTIMNLILQFKK